MCVRILASPAQQALTTRDRVPLPSSRGRCQRKCGCVLARAPAAVAAPEASQHRKPYACARGQRHPSHAGTPAPAVATVVATCPAHVNALAHIGARHTPECTAPRPRCSCRRRTPRRQRSCREWEEVSLDPREGADPTSVTSCDTLAMRLHGETQQEPSSALSSRPSEHRGHQNTGIVHRPVALGT